MNVLVLGIDGYIGYPLAIELLKQGHKVVGIDGLIRRERVNNIGSDSLTKIDTIENRCLFLDNAFRGSFYKIIIETLDERAGTTFNISSKFLDEYDIDTIFHLAEQPSAPFSMREEDSVDTQLNNISVNLRILWAMKNAKKKPHLIKIGSMGEFGTPNCSIPEGMIPRECQVDEFIECPMGGLMFPRQPTSFYHLSKVFSTYNIEFCCRNWGLKSTDVMQGIVYGLNFGQMLRYGDIATTRFDYDQYFGTVINRFVTQTIAGMPLTIYGPGTHIRSFLTLEDSIECLILSMNNPPKDGEYRSINQFGQFKNMIQLALAVQEASSKIQSLHTCEITYIPNPRNEKEIHLYDPEIRFLAEKGYVPDNMLIDNIQRLLTSLIPYKDRIKKEVIMPTTKWS